MCLTHPRIAIKIEYNPNIMHVCSTIKIYEGKKEEEGSIFILNIEEIIRSTEKVDNFGLASARLKAELRWNKSRSQK